jgi:orotate phosphoribosyltransferase
MKNLLKQYSVTKTGRFQLTSGKHSDQYINKDDIYSNPILFSKIVNQMYKDIIPYIDRFDIITGPAIAGAILAAPISLSLNKIFIYPEKIDGNMVFRRGYDKLLRNKRVWIIEDIITTGGSIEKTIAAVVKCKGEVVGISAIWDRGSWSVKTNIPFLTLIHEFVSSYWPNECPFCKARKPLQNPKE